MPAATSGAWTTRPTGSSAHRGRTTAPLSSGTPAAAAGGVWGWRGRERRCAAWSSIRAAVRVGSADRHAYVYDVRAVSAGPVAVFAGHGRAVTYVRFAGWPGRVVVSSGTDGSHRLWDWVGGGGGGGVEELRAYSGHANALRFVGMSVWRTGCSSRAGQKATRFSCTTSGGRSQYGCGNSRSTGGRVRQRHQLEASSGDGGAGRGRAARRRI